MYIKSGMALHCQKSLCDIGRYCHTYDGQNKTSHGFLLFWAGNVFTHRAYFKRDMGKREHVQRNMKKSDEKLQV